MPLEDNAQSGCRLDPLPERRTPWDAHVETCLADAARSDAAGLASAQQALSIAFEPADRALFDAHVPWTRILSPMRTTGLDGEQIDLLPYVEARQSDLVLKPTNGTWGEGIVIGRETAPEVWKAGAADAAASGGIIVQEFVEAITTICPAPGKQTPAARKTDLNAVGQAELLLVSWTAG